MPKEFNPPTLQIWVKFYRVHRKLWRFFTTRYSQLGGIPSLHTQVLHTVTHRLQSDHYLATDHTAFVQPISTVEKAYAIFYSHIRDDIAKVPLTEKSKTLIKDTFLCHDFLFIMKIVLPAWLLYGKNYVAVYRQATQGNLQALEELLRLDKIQIQNPRINKWIYLHACNRNNLKLKTILDAIAGPPRKKISLQRVKYLLAGLISVSSELFGQRLTAPEIQSLFDAVAVDYGVDPLRDPDLPESPEAFSKAIQRERDFWLPVLYPQPDKTIS